MTKSGNHGIIDQIPWNFVKMCSTNFKFLETTPNGPSGILEKFDDQRFM